MSRLRALLAAAALAALPLTGLAEDTGPFVLKEDSFVCVTPAFYAEALERAQAAPSRFQLAKDLAIEKKCIMVDEEDIEDMMAPFVLVTATEADMIRVQYEVEFYKRIAFLHRTFSRVIFSGWTHRDQLMPRADLGKR